MSDSVPPFFFAADGLYAKDAGFHLVQFFTAPTQRHFFCSTCSPPFFVNLDHYLSPLIRYRNIFRAGILFSPFVRRWISQARPMMCSEAFKSLFKSRRDKGVTYFGPSFPLAWVGRLGFFVPFYFFFSFLASYITSHGSSAVCPPQTSPRQVKMS